MAKLTKKQKKMAEMLEGFVQPSTAVDAIKKLIIIKFTNIIYKNIIISTFFFTFYFTKIHFLN